MSVGEGVDERRRADVAVVDREVPATGWQQIDLARTLQGLPATGEAGRPARLRAETSVLSFPDRTSHLIAAVSPPAAKRLPPAVFVSVGRSLRTGGRYAKRGPSGSANDNVAGRAPAARSVWRDLFFLAVLFATVAGAFWSGRVHGLQKIIVVPGPSSFNTVVT